MNIHLIAPFHTITSETYSHCAFTGKALRFSKMMRLLDYNITEYSNEGSTSEANTHVKLLTKGEFEKFFSPIGSGEMIGKNAVIGSTGWTRFHTRLIGALCSRVEPFDIIAHPFGRAHMSVVKLFPKAIHVETGIGYNDLPFGAWRIFESETWRHYHWGRQDYDVNLVGDNGLNRHYSWVIPNYFDVKEWTYCSTPGCEDIKDYALFMNRIDPCKGLFAAADIIIEWEKLYPESQLHFAFAGQGNIAPLRERVGEPLYNKRVRYLGQLVGSERNAWAGGARCMLMPTMFVEPFGGAGIEGMLTGTPLIASDWGAFTETIQNGVNGYRCKVLADWIRGIQNSAFLNRSEIAERARSNYSLEACAYKYHRAFEQMAHQADGKGWYDVREIQAHEAALHSHA